MKTYGLSQLRFSDCGLGNADCGEDMVFLRKTNLYSGLRPRPLAQLMDLSHFRIKVRRPEAGGTPARLMDRRPPTGEAPAKQVLRG